jgi:TatA/E family protein of Tat protein translocase
MIAGHLPEILIIAVVAVIFLGPKRLPEAGRGLGKALKGFKDETKGLREDLSSIKEETDGLKEQVTSIQTDVHKTVTSAVDPRVSEKSNQPSIDAHPLETTAHPAEPVAVGTAIDSHNRVPEPEKGEV